MSTDLTVQRSGAVTAPGRDLPAFEKSFAVAERGLEALDRISLDRDTMRAASDAVSWPGRPAQALELLPRLPTERQWAEHVEQVRAVAEAKPDRVYNRALLALLLDCFPSGRPPNVKVYLSALVHDVTRLGFSPHAVAAACRDLREEAPAFLPAVSEVIAACRKAQTRLEGYLSTAEHWGDTLNKVRALAAQAEPNSEARNDH